MRRDVLRASLATALIFGISTLAVAQYGGGGGMGGGMPGSPTYAPHGTYNSKGAMIGGIAGGAAVGGGLLYWKLHNRAKLQGCVAGDGNSLVSEKDNQTYSLTSKQNESLEPGERCSCKARTSRAIPANQRSRFTNDVEPVKCVYLFIQGTGPDSEFKATAKLGAFLEAWFSGSF